MNKLPPEKDPTPEPDSTTREKDTIRKSQEEFVDDMARPSMTQQEYDERQGKGEGKRPQTGEDDSTGPEQH